MKTLVYMSNSLEEIEETDQELEEMGIPRDHIHVLSEDESALDIHGLPAVNEIEKRDVVRSGSLGAALGVVLASTAIVMAGSTGIATQVGWAPFVLLAAILFGFCTWEGVMIGLTRINHRFRQFQDVLHRGVHLLMIDVEGREEARAVAAVHRNSRLAPVGVAR